MRSYILLSAALTSALIASAQSGGIRLAPHWYVGDKRIVTVSSSIHLQTSDTTAVDVTNASAFNLAVTDLRKTGFVLSVGTDQSDELTMDLLRAPGDSSKMRDNLTAQKRSIVNAVYDPMKKLVTDFSITRTGEAAEILDKDKAHETLKDKTQDAVVEMLNLDGDGKHRTLEELDTKVDHMVDSLYGAFLAVQVNEVKYLLQGYAYTFPETGSVRLPLKAHHVEQPILSDFGELPAMMDIGVDKLTPKQLVGRVVTTYNADSLFKVLPHGTKKDPLKRQGLELTDESVYTFDRASGWLIAATTVINFRSNKFRMRISTATSLTVVKP